MPSTRRCVPPILATALLLAATLPVAAAGLQATAAPRYFSALAPTPPTLESVYNRLHRPEWGGAWSGVAKLELLTTSGGFGCSGALLGGGAFMLTAAHCVSDGFGRNGFLDGVAYFPTLATGRYTGRLQGVRVAGAIVHPGWEGDYLYGGHDLALLRLAAPAPAAARRYELYEGGDEVGQVGVKVGWGLVGLGNGESIGEAAWTMGRNRYDATATTMMSALGAAPREDVLQYDFDDGSARHDGFGFFFGMPETGVGRDEVMSAPGDSGGPTFIDGRIAGITSYGVTLRNADGTSSDASFGLDSSWGEFGGDTRVSAYAPWIHAAMVPEPSAWALLLAGLGMVAAAARRRYPVARAT